MSEDRQQEADAPSRPFPMRECEEFLDRHADGSGSSVTMESLCEPITKWMPLPPEMMPLDLLLYLRYRVVCISREHTLPWGEVEKRNPWMSLAENTAIAESADWENIYLSGRNDVFKMLMFIHFHMFSPPWTWDVYTGARIFGTFAEWLSLRDYFRRLRDEMPGMDDENAEGGVDAFLRKLRAELMTHPPCIPVLEGCLDLIANSPNFPVEYG